MQSQNKILFGKWEAITLLINLICAKIFLYFPRMMVEDAGTAGWIMTIFISIIIIIYYSVLIKLYKKFEGKDILDISEIAGGRVLKVLMGLTVSGILFYSAILILREFSEDFKVIILPNSPLSYIMSFFIICVVIGSFLGFEAIVRYHAIIIPVIAIGFIIIMLITIPLMDLTNILPLLGNGPSDILRNGLLRTMVFGELLVLFLLPPFLGSYKNVRSAGYAAIVFSSVFFIIASLGYILTFPYPSNLEAFLPIYQLARLINLGRFFQRIEALFVFIWAMAAFVYLSAMFYLMVYTFSKAFGLKYIRPMIIPFAILVFSAAFIPESLVEVIKMESQSFKIVVWMVAFVFSYLVMLVAGFRKKVSRKEKGL